MSRVRDFLEILGGSRPLPASVARFSATHVALGLWWVCLLLLAFSFAGRTVKFVYIDF